MQEIAVPSIFAAIELFLQHMVAAIVRAIQTQQIIPRPVETSSSLRDFCRLNPLTFHRKMDPLVAENWLKQITKVLDGITVDDDAMKFYLATFQLKRPIQLWWECLKNTQGGVRWYESYSNSSGELLPSSGDEENKTRVHGLEAVVHDRY